MNDEEQPEPPLDPVRIFETLNRHGVDYTIIGGMAVIAHGHIRATRDVDVVASLDRENLQRLAAALGELDARLRGIDAHLLPVSPTNPDDLGAGGNWTMVTAAGRLDFLPDVPGGVVYEDIRARSVQAQHGAVDVHVIGLDDLLRLKRAAGRPRDLADIEALTRERGG